MLPASRASTGGPGNTAPLPSPGATVTRADLESPLPTFHPQLAELHDQFARARIEQLDDARTTPKARELIVAKIPDGEPKRAAIASALRMTERSLQRRLQHEGTSFNGCG